MVSVLQKFGGALNANPHFHSNLVDGTFSRSVDGTLFFHEAPMLKQQDITLLCSRLRLRVLEMLQKRGLLWTDAELDPFADSEPLLASISGASLTSRIATGSRAGKKVFRLGRITTTPSWVTRKRPLGAHIDGFDLHAGAALAAGDRRALESLLRYQLRPPLSKTRLSRLTDGRVKVKQRSKWSDGTTHIVLEPHELIEKLAALVPRPRSNLMDKLFITGALPRGQRTEGRSLLMADPLHPSRETCHRSSKSSSTTKPRNVSLADIARGPSFLVSWSGRLR
jgi:hypothetical protein